MENGLALVTFSLLGVDLLREIGFGEENRPDFNLALQHLDEWKASLGTFSSTNELATDLKRFLGSLYASDLVDVSTLNKFDKYLTENGC